MASIIKKTIKGNAYYYLVETKRVDGKPKRVSQVYLGSAETILKRLESQKIGPALYSEIEAFGDVCLIYDLAERLSLVEMLDNCLPKRNQGLSLGTYTLIAVINRAVSPTSKVNISKWYSKTILQKLMGIPKSQLSCQRFWDNMNTIEDEHIMLFEETFLETVLSEYSVDTSRLIYDATNFFTFLSSENESELAKRGHSKENRTNLKIVGLSMMITPDLNMPLLYDVYPGNTGDSVEFKKMIIKMKERYTKITGNLADITISFDRGNNAEDNLNLLEGDKDDNKNFPFYYVGGLKLNQISDLLDIPKTQYSRLDIERGETKIKVYRTQQNIFDRYLTVLVTFDPHLFRKHRHTFQENIEKTESELKSLQSQLATRAAKEKLKGKPMTEDSVQNRLNAILERKHMKKVFDTEIVIGADPKKPLIKFSINKKESAALEGMLFGKRAFFTNRHEWTNEEIVSAYDSSWHVESAFRQLKDTDYLSVRPLYHWTDQKIKVHIFFCILAYRLCCLLRQELKSLGINITINKMIESLSMIKKVITVFGTSDSDIIISLSKGDDIAECILEKLQLRRKYLS